MNYKEKDVSDTDVSDTDVSDTDVGEMKANKEVVFIDGVKEEGECPRSENDKNCPVCKKKFVGMYGIGSGYGVGTYNICDDHGVFDFRPDEE